MTRRILVALLILGLAMATPVRALSIDCNGNATYSHGKVQFTCDLINVTGFYTLEIVTDKGDVYETSGYINGTGNGSIPVEFPFKSLVPDRFKPLPDVTFSRLRVPFWAYLREYKGSKVVGETRALGVLSVRFSPTDYLPFLLVFLVFFVFFVEPTSEYKSGRAFATDVLALQFFFRGAVMGWLTALVLMPFVSYNVVSNPELGDSALVLSGLTVLFLLQSVYALGFKRAKYPKISFYTGLEWTMGIPQAFYFLWPDDYAVPLVIGFIIALFLFVVLWRYAELSYSKCRGALSFFRRYATPLSIALALLLVSGYVTYETAPLFAIFLLSLVAYAFTSNLAFEKLVWAKKKFDEDIGRIMRGRNYDVY